MQLKDLPKDKQLEYTAKLLELYKEMQNPAHTCDWSDIIELRRLYDLPVHSKDSLRRAVVMRELIEAEMIVPNTSWMTDINDVKQGEANIFIPSQFQPQTFKQSTDYITSRTTSEAVLHLSQEDISNPDILLEKHGFNPKEFNLLKARHSLWQQGSKKAGVKDLVSSKIEVEPKNKKNGELSVEEIKSLFEDLVKIQEENVDRVETTFENYKYDSNCLVLYTPDLHFGRRSDSIETGVNWNLDKALNQAKDNITQIIHKIKNKDLERIVYVINSDSINSEYTKYTSSGRNLQDNSDSVSTIYKKVSEFFINAIKQLSKLAPVRVVSIPGNHAGGYEFTLGLLLQAYFHDNIAVTFDVDATPRKMAVYGDNLIVFAHGDKEGVRLKEIVPNEFRQAWGYCKNHYLLAAHLHHMVWEECVNGLEVITLNSATLNDKYTNDKGFKSKNRISAFLFSKENLEEVLFVTNN